MKISKDQVVWQTDKIIVFRDEQGRVWRYMKEFRQMWPIEVGESKPESISDWGEI